MFAIKSTSIDTKQEFKISQVTNGNKTVVDFDFSGRNGNFEITLCFEDIHEAHLYIIIRILNEFRTKIWTCMNSTELMQHVIDFNGQFSEPYGFIIIIHGSFTSEFRKQIYTQFCKQISIYRKTIEDIVYEKQTNDRYIAN